MKKKYFTALIPESNLDIKYKRMQIDSSWCITFPPIAILEYYNTPILKEDFPIDIDNIPEFKTGPLFKKNNLWVVELPLTPFINHFPLTDLYIILGEEIESNRNTTLLTSDTIRNWELGFYELIDWNEEEPLTNFELILHWKIKKRRPKG